MCGPVWAGNNNNESAVIAAKNRGGGVTNGLIGYSGSSVDTGYLGSDDAAFTDFETTTAGTVSYIHANLKIASGDFNVAIYSSDGLTKLAENSLTTISADDTWAHFELDSPLVIAESTTYRILVGSKTDSNWGVNWGDSGTVQKEDAFDVEDTMPATATSDQQLSGSRALLIYADNNAT